MAGKKQDLTGQKWALLTAVAFDRIECGVTYWLFRCDCGNERSIRAGNVRRGMTKSCGCSRRELLSISHTRHGHCRDGRETSEYQAWNLARQRCHSPIHRAFPSYGGRGIEMCDRWRFGDGERAGFECFVADMGERPSAKHSLDRIDNDQGYSPENCRWATRSEQMRNTRSNRYVEFGGRKITIIEASELTGLAHATITKRLDLGWPVERALTKPSRGYRG